MTTGIQMAVNAQAGIVSLPECVLRLFATAQRIAQQTPEFFTTKGPGKGDHAALAFMAGLRKVVDDTFGANCRSEHKVCRDAGFAVDFYFPNEATVVELALSLDKPIAEYERDIFKCLLAQQHGCTVKRLIFIGKPGAQKKNNAPGPKAIAQFVKDKFGLDIAILELAPGNGQSRACWV